MAFPEPQASRRSPNPRAQETPAALQTSSPSSVSLRSCFPSGPSPGVILSILTPHLPSAACHSLGHSQRCPHLPLRCPSVSAGRQHPASLSSPCSELPLPLALVTRTLPSTPGPLTTLHLEQAPGGPLQPPMGSPSPLWLPSGRRPGWPCPPRWAPGASVHPLSLQHGPRA